MPVRKIPKNALFVTGGFASRKNNRLMGFESPLERDHLLLLEFNRDVESFEEQPVKISFKGTKGRMCSYVPDVFVRYLVNQRPQLIEVKGSVELKRKAKKLAPKFAAARAYCEEQGWDFVVITEKKIRGPYLQNLKFLREYREVDPDTSAIERILQFVDTAKRRQSVNTVLAKVAPDLNDRLTALPALWFLVVNGRLCIDFKKPITHDTLVSRVKENP